MTGGPQSDDRRDPQHRRPGDLAGIDKQGLLFDDMDDLRDFQIPYAKNRKQLGVAAENRMGLVDTIKMASPTILLGCSTVHGAFTRAVIQAGLLLMQLIFNVIVFENGRGTISISSSWDPSSEAPSC